MSRETDNVGIINFDAAGVIPLGTLVKLDSAGTVSVAGITEEPIGAARAPAFASGDNIGVAMTSKPGTVTCIAAGAFAVGVVLYGRASGEVDDDSTGTALRVGIAIEAATASGDYVQVLLDR